MALQQPQGAPRMSVRRRESLWPPVGPMARAEMNRRGPGIRPELDRGLDAPVGAAGVAHRGEAAIDHAAHQLGRLGGQQGERHALEIADVHLGQEHMDVAVDQPRHQGALAAAVHHLGVARLDRLGRHFFYVLALDQHLVAAARLVPARVEQAEILEQNLRHRRSPPPTAQPYAGRRFGATVQHHDAAHCRHRDHGVGQEHAGGAARPSARACA